MCLHQLLPPSHLIDAVEDVSIFQELQLVPAPLSGPSGLCRCSAVQTCVPWQLLFCSTETGIMSFVRQLEPDLHIESSPTVVDQLKVSTPLC